MFRVIGATVVYGLAVIGLVQVLKSVRLKGDGASHPQGRTA
jgi:hypothetical protein